MAVAATENPLVEGLERLPVPATTLVIFGATRRPRAAQAPAGALQPRPRGRAAGALQPDRRIAPRPSRRRVPRAGARVDRRVLPPHPERRGARRPRRPHALPRHPVRRRAGLCAPGRGDGRARRRGRPAAQPRLLPLDGAGVLPRHHGGDQGERAAPVRARRRARGDREAVRHRPRLGALAPGRRALRLPRAPGLPHRSLPGQGDRPERDGVPVRELHVRAGLEPQLHRPHPDHRGRGHRHRHPRRLLRLVGRTARPRAEPHAPAAHARLHGAADDVPGQQGARREGQGAAGDRAADARAGRAR